MLSQENHTLPMILLHSQPHSEQILVWPLQENKQFDLFDDVGLWPENMMMLDLEMVVHYLCHYKAPGQELP